jgi:exodeoxyribonuclease VII small subunit
MTAKKDSAIPIEKLGYEEAMADLDSILAELESEEGDLDQLAERVKRAGNLVRQCREKIEAAEMEVEKVLKELPAAADAQRSDDNG